MAAASNGFTFKQFHVNHDRCAMKVGTDAVLLGSKADVAQVQSILEFGTGTGLVALMLAQRSHQDARISAVEIEPQAFMQAQENVADSPWPEKIRLYCQDIADFARTCKQKFDLIVANPPYFEAGIRCHSSEREKARYMIRQCHADWLNLAAALLTEKGKIQFILPYSAGHKLITQTALFCTEYCEIITKQGKPPQRLLLTFESQPSLKKESRIIIYNADNCYHTDFITLTRDFYLTL